MAPFNGFGATGHKGAALKLACLGWLVSLEWFASLKLLVALGWLAGLERFIGLLGIFLCLGGVVEI